MYSYRHNLINKILIFAENKLKPLSISRFVRRSKLSERVYSTDICKTLNKDLGIYFAESFNEVDIKKIITCADEIFQGNIELLGCSFNLKSKCWHSDPITGYLWRPNKYYTAYKTIDKNNNSDVKRPWELSRCHHLLWMAQAYFFSKDEKYAIYVVSEIDDWIDNNKFERSINWTCSMEVAIRSVNWMYSIHLISGSTSLKSSFIQKFQHNIYLHGLHIVNNLEYSFPYNANHYMSNIVGLIFISHFLYELPKSKEWFDFAVREFFFEVRSQIIPSGEHFEKTISYHRLTTEMVLAAYYLLKRNNIIIPLDVVNRIKRMLDFISIYLKPDGSCQLIGDNDDGRFLPFMKRDYSIHSYLVEPKSFENIYLSADCDVLEARHNYKSGTSFVSDSGLCFVKNENISLSVSNTDSSRFVEYGKNLIATHTHNDKLSFTLAINGHDIIVDPGTYVYTSDVLMRNEFRSTRKHNTIMVDNEEQNLLLDNVFAIIVNSKNNCLSLRKDTKLYITGSYETINGNLWHERIIECYDKSINIKDKLSKKGNNHLAEMFFHFSPNVNVVIKGNRVEILYEDNKAIITSKSDVKLSFDIVDDTISPSYGTICKSKTLVIKFEFNIESEINTKIEWGRKYYL